MTGRRMPVSVDRRGRSRRHHLLGDVTITPAATGRVHALTEQHAAKNELYVEWPHVGVVLHKLRDLPGMYSIGSETTFA
ncbi:hypothetical protein ACIQUC_15320 [Curtobacterium sp. NPDC098951]|uniref:hypothetical protein n=1 Tax=Curtobacterium sp. NPDC098951 TaxID=3363974 RepID=UPI0037F45C65